MATVERTEHPEFTEPDDRRVRVAELAALEQGWLGDGYGAPMAAAWVATASRVLHLMAINGIQMPGVFPNPDGYIQLEWADATNYREWECLPDGSIAHFDLSEARAAD